MEANVTFSTGDLELLHGQAIARHQHREYDKSNDQFRRGLTNEKDLSVMHLGKVEGKHVGILCGMLGEEAFARHATERLKADFKTNFLLEETGDGGVDFEIPLLDGSKLTIDVKTRRCHHGWYLDHCIPVVDNPVPKVYVFCEWRRGNQVAVVGWVGCKDLKEEHKRDAFKGEHRNWCFSMGQNNIRPLEDLYKYIAPNLE